MNPQTPGIRDSLNNITDDATDLLAATAEMAQENVVAARNRLASAMEAAGEMCTQAQKKAVQTAKATDTMVRTHPYQAIGVAFGIGALVGYLLARKGR